MWPSWNLQPNSPERLLVAAEGRDPLCTQRNRLSQKRDSCLRSSGRFSPPTPFLSSKKRLPSFASGYSLPGRGPLSPPLSINHGVMLWPFSAWAPQLLLPRKFPCGSWCLHGYHNPRVISASAGPYVPLPPSPVNSVTKAVTNEEVWAITWPHLSNHILASFFRTRPLGVGRVQDHGGGCHSRALQCGLGRCP